jgi:L,D-transpeptidase YcbB
MSKTMQALYTILILLFSCQEQQEKVIAVKRDFSITQKTAYSSLFFDSMQLETFIKGRKASDSIATQMRNFYKRRNYQYAWFTENGIAEHTRSFWNLHNNYTSEFGDTIVKDKMLHQQIDQLLGEDTTLHLRAEVRLQTELALTMHFLEYTHNAYAGKLNPKELQWHIPRKKINATALLDSLIAREGKNLQDWEPVNIFYQRLTRELHQYRAIDKAGGWKQIKIDKQKTFKPGDSSPIIKYVKLRLKMPSDGSMIDSSEIYSPEFMNVVMGAQKSFGLKENGVITEALVKQLNIPVAERIKQMLVNLERMRWVPQQSGGTLVLVNIPEFKLHVIDSGKKLFSIKIVTGKATNNTVVFTGQLKYVVFSPYWNVPRSIVRNEILPAIRRNPNYLAKMNMEQIGYTDGLPVIRQRPGGANALGRVKFIFPNSYNIYLHDTPAKSLFNQDFRAFSHGCIRLEEPVKLATYLLRNQPEWTMEKMNEAMSTPVEKWVTLQKTLPVFITYFTAWVDSEGLLNFRDDVYGHDKRLAKDLFEQ